MSVCVGIKISNDNKFYIKYINILNAKYIWQFLDREKFRYRESTNREFYNTYINSLYGEHINQIFIIVR